MTTDKHIPTLPGIIILSIIAIASGLLVVNALNKRLEAIANDLQAQINEIKQNVAVKPSITVFEERLFSVSAPVAWKRIALSDSNSTNAPATSNYATYGDDNGNYFQVNFDQAGRDFNSDSVWIYKVNAKGDGVAIVSEGKLCKHGDAFCSAGDSKLDIYAVSENPGDVKIKGHDYFFNFGNTKKESEVDLQVFRDILLSFKAK